MKVTLRCLKCDGNRIVYIDRIADATQMGKPPRFRPMLLATRSEYTGEGMLSAYVCRDCGYTEFYVKDPENIVADGELNKDLVGPRRRGPYRE